MTTARAFWIEAPGVGAIRDESLDDPGTGDVQIRTLFSGISRGTETLIFTGRVPASQVTTMRCPFQVGEFPGPVKYGYASVGRVEAGDPALQNRTVFCLYPHQDRYVVPSAAVEPLPDGVPPARAVLAANMETALNVVWDSGIGPGDRVAVIGLGVVGLLVARLVHRIPGTDLIGCDTNPDRRTAADALGIQFHTAAADGFDADVVVHASGSPEGLRSALVMAGIEATIVEASWYGTTEVPLPLGEAFHSRRLTLKSTQVGLVAGSRRARWTTSRRLAKALSLLDDPALDVLIDSESPFERLPETMAALADGRSNALCHRIRYDG